MWSDDKWFLRIPGIVIANDRNQKDYAGVDDNLFSGMQTDTTYPNVLSWEYIQDNLYGKKGDKVKL